MLLSSCGVLVHSDSHAEVVRAVAAETENLPNWTIDQVCCPYSNLLTLISPMSLSTKEKHNPQD